ncbi:MAG: hypothetical protein KAR06_09905 [Deltaproteobacteria bacterium]|nr:hypothetical protein [Deltaproteobacteria bacterium]
MDGSSINASVFGAVVLLLIAGGGAMVILWLVMPFSIFGLKDKLDDIMTEQKKTQDTIKELQASIKAIGTPGESETFTENSNDTQSESLPR